MKKYVIENFVNSRKLAVVENGELCNFIIEDHYNKSRVNNIYKGKVKKIIKSMDAAYVDIGEKNQAYLRIDKKMDLVEGSEVLVQLIKDEKGDKRAKLSLDISIQGKYLVLLPLNDRLVFSNKIRNKEEKDRLTSIINRISPNFQGYILRTDSVGAEEEELNKEIKLLKYIHLKIVEDFKSNNIGYLYGENSPIYEYIVSKFNPEEDEVILGENDEFKDDINFNNKVRGFIKKLNPRLLSSIKVEKNTDVFEVYGINNLMKKYISKSIWFDKGAHIVIDRLEAMTVIDINSGRFSGNSHYEDTVFKVNMSAAEEISRQIKIRDISGIILVDFIDMKSSENKDKLIKRLKTLLKDDRKTTTYGFTSLGLIEISRMRKGNSIIDYFSKSDNYEITYGYLVDLIEQEIIYRKYHLEETYCKIDIGKFLFNNKYGEYTELISFINDEYDENNSCIFFNRDEVRIIRELVLKLKEKYGVDIKFS